MCWWAIWWKQWPQCTKLGWSTMTFVLLISITVNRNSASSLALFLMLRLPDLLPMNQQEENSSSIGNQRREKPHYIWNPLKRTIKSQMFTPLEFHCWQHFILCSWLTGKRVHHLIGFIQNNIPFLTSSTWWYQKLIKEKISLRLKKKWKYFRKSIGYRIWRRLAWMITPKSQRSTLTYTKGKDSLLMAIKCWALLLIGNNV